MKQSKNLFALLLAVVVFMGSCIEPNKDIKYNKYTKTDTEAFTFLKTTYEQALFQQYATKNYDLGAQSQKISQTYQALAEEIVKLATENNVLEPSFSADHFDEKAGVSVNPTLANDTLTAMQSNVIAKVGSESIAQKVIHSQEEIVHQFEIASRNTNLSIRHFGNEKLAELEELLEQSKSSIK